MLIEPKDKKKTVLKDSLFLFEVNFRMRIYRFQISSQSYDSVLERIANGQIEHQVIFAPLRTAKIYILKYPTFPLR